MQRIQLQREAIGWYRKIIRAAFTVNWPKDEDAVYVLTEARRLFRLNRYLSHEDDVRRKLREAELRYELAIHYKIPYPRPYNKSQGASTISGVAYSPYLDSQYELAPVNPFIGHMSEDNSTGFLSVGHISNPGGDLYAFEKKDGYDRQL